MKKISILLILCMMISLLPALNVSAAVEEYYLKGLYEGETVVIQQQPTKTVTLVDFGNKTTAEPTVNYTPMVIKTTASNVSKVVFTFNDNAPQTIMGATLSYTMTFTELGTQTLKYDVYKTGNSSDTPDESKTITFNVVSGKRNAASVDTVTFENGADINTIFAAQNGNSDYTTVERTNSAGDTSYALNMTTARGNGFAQFKGAAAATGNKVHYYEFDIAMNGAYNKTIYLCGNAYNNSSNRVQLFRNRSFTKHSSNYETHKAQVILDYNENIASINFDGIEWGQVDISDAVENGTAQDGPVLSLYIQGIASGNNIAQTVYIDNFKYDVYDVVPVPSFTGASIAGGDKPVLETQSQVRITGSSAYLDGQDAADFVTLTERANDSTGDFTESSIDYSASIDGTDIVVNFNETLAAGTTYKINIDGIKDEYLMTYAGYSFTFRTLNEGENPLPEVALTSPAANDRYYPNEADTVTLSATAVDTLGGTIAYVEFYADGVLIEGSRVETGVDDVYTYVWVLDGSIDKEEPVAITAKAVDNEGGDSTSAAVNIVLLSKSAPSVTITAPAQNTVYCANVAGVDMDVFPKIEFTTEDADGTIEDVKVYVYGEPGVTVPDPATATEYTLTSELAVGEHTLVVEVTDNHGLKNTDSVAVTVEAMGKSGYVIREDYTDAELTAKWNKSGDVTERTYDAEKGVILSVAEGGTGAASLNRVINHNFTDKAFVASIKVSFDDTATKRVIMLGDAELATFSASGQITYGDTQVAGLTYTAGQVYDVTAVADPESGKVYGIVDGTETGSKEATFTTGAKIVVSNEGEGNTTISSATVSLIDIAVVPTVEQTGNTFTVGFAAGVDLTTLEGNVSLVNLTTGKAASLSYADGVFTVNEALKSTDTYEIIVLPDARDLNGKGYSGTFHAPFTPAAATEVVAEVGVTGGSLNTETGVYTATLEVDFSNGVQESKTVCLVYAAYKGAKMVDYGCEFVEAPVTASGINLSLSNVDADTVIEAFVVDNMDDLNSVSDKILKIK